MKIKINKSDKTFFSKIKDYLKENFYTVIHLILKEEEINIFVAALLTFIEFIQLFYYYFCDSTY